jgi:hypothetical protein
MKTGGTAHRKPAERRRPGENRRQFSLCRLANLVPSGRKSL